MQLPPTHTTFAASAILLFTAAAQPRCMPPEFGPYKEAERLCGIEMPDSHDQCRTFLGELAAMETRSSEQAIALAYGRTFMVVAGGNSDDRESELAKANAAGREVLKPFVDANPDDPMLLLAYADLHIDDQDASRALLDRVLELEPSCGDAAVSLVLSLEGSEALKYLAHGYAYSQHTRKLWFAVRKYEALLDRYWPETDAAEAFLQQVAVDMRDLRLDSKNRATTAEMLCSANGLEKLRLQTHCIEAIETLLARDRHAHAPLGDDVLEALATVAVEVGAGVPAERLAHWRQMLEAEPEPLRTARFYVVYAQLHYAAGSFEAEAEALRRALALDPQNGKIGLYLSGALERIGRPDEAKEVYRHVVANADRRAVEEGYAADFYATEAAGRLRELEEEDNVRPTEVE